MASELYEQLVITYTSTDNVLRNRTEQMLVQSLIDNIQNFQFIAKLAEKQDKMQEQASSLLNQVILKMIVNNQAQLSVQHALSLIQIIISQTTPLKCKQSLIKAMSLMVKKDKQLRTEIENQMREYLKKEQYWQILSGIVFFKILIDSLEFQTYSVVQSTGYEWINEFFNSTSNFMTKLQEQPQELNDEFIITIKYYTQIVNDLCEKVFKQNVMSREQVQPIQNLLFQLNSFSGILMILLQYSPQKGNQLSNSIILNSGIQQFDNQLNEIKSNVLKSFTLILSVLLNSRNKSEVKKGAFGPYINSLCQLLLYSILAYTNNENINIILNKPFQKEIMTYLMKLLACLGTQTELYQLFSDAKVALITDVIYPFLITTKEEYQQMKEEPEEFVNLALDTVDKQESDIPKTAAAQLLETLCDHIDGSTTFLANLAIIIAQYSINEISTNPQPFKEQQQLLVQALIEKKLFKIYSSIDRIESSLLILTIMSYLIQKRGDIINAMEQLLLENINFFQNIQESILKVRLSLFFGYFCDNLFKKEIQSQNMIAYLQILINFVQPNEPVVLYQSIDSLKDVFEDDDLKQKVKNLVITLFPQLCSGLSFSTYERHFEMITNLLKRFPQQFLQNENLFIGMAQVLVQRIIYEQQQINNGVQQRHIHLNRCWNIIRTIPDESDLAPLLKLLEEQLVPLYQMLAREDKIDFDEDLILFISNCISKLSSVTSYQIQVLPYFAKIIQQQKGRLGNLYETLNQYIHFGKNYFLDENNQRIFFQLAFQNLQSEHYQGDIELAEGALLIQLGIQELQNQININILTDILQQVIIYLQKLKKEGNKTLYSRVMGIILSSFYSVTQLTYEILKDLFTQIFNLIIETDYTPGYDIKLFIVTLCSLIQQQPKLLDVKLITTLINNLTKQQKHEKDQQDKQNMSFDQDDDDENDDDDDYNDDEEMNQAQQQIETFLSPIVKLDEYTLFNTTLQQLANGNPQLFDQIKQVIDPSIFNKLKEIILLIRIPTTDGQDLIRPIISAKKRKGQKN